MCQRSDVESGAREIDIVITRTHVLTGDWRSLYDEIRQFRLDRILEMRIGE